MRKKSPSSYIKIIAVIIATLAYMGFKALPVSKNAEAKDELFSVTRVVDGDTLKLSTGEKVRLIGVDTPEIHYSAKLLKDADRHRKDVKAIQALGKKSSDFTKKLCLDKKVRLEFDVERRDRYGRLLAYVYLEDGTFVNARIIQEGYGQVMTVPPNVRYREHFLKLQREARESGKGLWGIKGGL